MTASESCEVDADDLEQYTLNGDEVRRIEGLFVAALNEAGFPCQVDRGGKGVGASEAPDEVWVQACNIIRAALGTPQFPNVAAWRAWCDRP